MNEDDVFDLQLPYWMRTKSAQHFTPVSVARHAARLLAPNAGTRVLDVGAGPGKFCIVAAKELPSCTFVGVEIRPQLVKLARRVAAQVGVPNATFILGNALDLSWAEYDAFYFYNPFAEPLHDATSHLDRSRDLEPSRFEDDVASTRHRLAAARIGTRIVTYHSFGGPLPEGYDLIETHPIGTHCLDLWIKER